MKTKEEVIKEAYGEHWHLVEKYVNENGWIKSMEFSYYQNINGMSDIPIVNIFGGNDSHFLQTKSDYLGDSEYERYWRPKSLQGIENNNGWVKIESEDDLPKVKCTLHVHPNYLENDIFFYYNDDDSKKELIQNHSHYIIIQKPKPPLY